METLLIADYLNGMDYASMIRKYRLGSNRIAAILRANYCPMRHHRYVTYHPPTTKGFLIRPTDKQAKRAMATAMQMIESERIGKK